MRSIIYDIGNSLLIIKYRLLKNENTDNKEKIYTILNFNNVIALKFNVKFNVRLNAIR